jgi:hypothetical protein
MVPRARCGLREFIDASNVPVLTINLLQALPKTPLWERLEKSGRLDDDASLESNVRFPDAVRRGRFGLEALHRARLYARAPVRPLHPPDGRDLRQPREGAGRAQLTLANVRRGLVLGFNIALRVGLLSDYRRVFWRAAREAIRRGQIEAVFNMGFVAHHMIRFTQEALAGQQNASFYAVRAEAAPRAAEAARIVIGASPGSLSPSASALAALGVRLREGRNCRLAAGESSFIRCWKHCSTCGVFGSNIEQNRM